MARSLDELIDFLLGEIALSGDHGCTPGEVISYIDKFYSQCTNPDEQSRTVTNEAASFPGPTIDRLFQERIWKWLTRHPDISVGKDRKGNKFSLSEVEGYCLPCESSQPPAASKPTGASDFNNDAVETSAAKRIESATASPAKPPSVPTATKSIEQLRIFVTEERMYLAICGHPKDVSKVFETEFALLSVIAASRASGILQSDLVRESGQDKRSVPKRTESLQAKGYIEKRAVLTRGTRTSRLFLRKFIGSSGSQLTRHRLGADAAQEEAIEVERSIDFKVLIQGLFDLLRSRNIVTNRDLRSHLYMQDAWRSKVLVKVVRKFEALGCIKRVRAASEDSQKEGWHYACVKLVREPTEKDLQTYYDAGSDFLTTEISEEVDHGSDDEYGEPPNVTDSTTLITQSLREVDRIIPHWNPDRQIPSLLSQLVCRAGLQGMSNTELRNASLGHFVQRPVENLVGRLSSRSMLSQPPDLRHFAIIRDTTITGTVAHYVHYSYRNFQTLVERGKVFWEGVAIAENVGKKKGKKRDDATHNTRDMRTERDNFGFPLYQQPSLHYINGKATLSDGIKAVNIIEIPFVKHDPTAIETGPGQFEVRYGRPQASTREQSQAISRQSGSIINAIPSEAASPNTKRETILNGARARPIGRPRKFVRGTEKFWQGQFLLAKNRGAPRRSKKTGLGGVMTDPAGLALFAARPSNFDDTLVRALSNRLPIPGEPQEINQDWVDKTLKVLDRTAQGVYLSPRGEQSHGFSRKRSRKGQTFILRSSRLNEVDFSSRPNVPLVRFYVSSAAHTFSSWRYDPVLKQTGLPDDESPPANLAEDSRQQTEPPASLSPIEAMVDTFHLNSSLASGYSPSVPTQVEPPSESPRPRKRARRKKAVSPSPPDLTNRSASFPRGNSSSTVTSAAAQLSPRQALFQIQTDDHRQRPPSGTLGPATSLIQLPPPLTTRAASRRKSTKPLPTSSAAFTPFEDSRMVAPEPEISASPTSSNGSLLGQASYDHFHIQNQDRPYTSNPATTEATRSAVVSEKLLETEETSPVVKDGTFQQNRVSSRDRGSHRVVDRASDSAEHRQLLNLSNSDTAADSANLVFIVNASRSTPSPVHLVSDEQNADFLPNSLSHDQTEVSAGGTETSVQDLATQSKKPRTALLPGLSHGSVTPSDAPSGPFGDSLSEQLNSASLHLDHTPAAASRGTLPDVRDMPPEPIGDAGTMDPPGVNPPLLENDVNGQSGLHSDVESLPELRESDPPSENDRPKKRVRLGINGGSIAVLRRKIVVEIIEKCNGAIPYSTTSLWNSFTMAWQKTGQSGKPDARTLRTTVKSLCDGGKCKQMKFTYKDKRGLMLTKAILARPEMSLMDPFVREMQKKMIEADPGTYYPPEMEVDPDLDRHLPSAKLPPVRQTEIVETKVKTSPVPAEIRYKRNDGGYVSGPRKKNERSRGVVNQSKNVVRLDRIGGPVSSRNADSSKNGFQRPKLSNFRDPAHHQAHFPGQHGDTTNEPQLRTESAQNPQTLVNYGDRLYRPRPGFIPQIPVGSQKQSDASTSASTHLAEAPEPRRGNVIWTELSTKFSLPRSLEEILSDNRSRNTMDHLQYSDSDWRRFEGEVDGVLKWENRSFNLFQYRVSGWNFINHTVGSSFHAESLKDVPISFHSLTWFDQYGNERKPEPRKVITKTLTDDRKATQFSNKKKRTSVSQAARRHKRKRMQDPVLITDANGQIIDVTGYVDSPVKRPRGTQYLRSMPEDFIYRIILAVVVVRTLIGGLDKSIVWPIVMRLFPEEDTQFIRDRWRTIQNKYRRDIDSLNEAMQERFLDAYAKDEVPTIDFDDLNNNDWDGMLEWAVRSLGKPAPQQIEDLPAVREHFTGSTDLIVEEEKGLREMLVYNTNTTIPAKEAALASVVFAMPYKAAPRISPYFPSLSESSDEDQQLSIAKSWALATILTPTTSFDPVLCREKLANLAQSPDASEALLEASIKALIREKAIIHVRGGSFGLGNRSYESSARFRENVDQRRTIHAVMLKRAAAYKLDVLDPAFRTGEQVVFQHTLVEDGDMVAILNLVSCGRIRLRTGPDVCRSRYGLSTEGYQTRLLEKEKLGFTVFLEQVQGRYVYDNPLENGMLPVPGLAELGNEKVAPPVWFDIHGRFLKELWEMIICAVVGIVSTRPGVNAIEISRTLSPTLRIRDTELVLRWMNESNVVQGNRGGGWETMDWWWLICGRSLECGF